MWKMAGGSKGGKEKKQAITRPIFQPTIPANLSGFFLEETFHRTIIATSIQTIHYYYYNDEYECI